MNILINASNLKVGGGLQVADSVCRELYKFPMHKFTIVLSSFFSDTRNVVEKYSNVRVFEYNIRNNIMTLLFGRDKYLDNLVKESKTEIVLTIFGPSRWVPKVKHLCGFAISQLLIPESPYFTIQNLRERWREKIYDNFLKIAFKRCSKHFYTENPFISKRLEELFPESTVYTVTNYYNQVFDHPRQWKEKRITKFEGITLLTIATPYPHKNVVIAAQAARYLKNKYPDFRFRFVFSFNRNEFKVNISGIEDCFEFIGSVDIAECPLLYKQCDIVFTPTLIECFTAAYPEAMKMEKPIVTTDLDFARGLCGDAALYYSALDAESCADAIYEVALNKELAYKLIENGRKQLEKFDNYTQRTNKLIEILTNIAK